MTATIIQFPVVPRPRPAEVAIVQAITVAAPVAEVAPATKFEVGKTYQARSIGDWDCIYSFKVVRRTAKRMTFLEHGKEVTRGIYSSDGVEACKPHGTYSMCAVIRADREIY